MDDMKEKWYMNDWFLSIMAAMGIVLAALGNYYLHGGRIIW